MTPDEFKKKMDAIKEKYIDNEYEAHEECDDLLISTLKSLGYSEGCKVYDKLSENFWYA